MKCKGCGGSVGAKANRCMACLEDMRNPFCEDMTGAGIKYSRSEWKLCDRSSVKHMFGLMFAIDTNNGGLSARIVEMEYEMLETDVQILTNIAVRAFLDLIGWNEPERPDREKLSEGKTPKPN